MRFTALLLLAVALPVGAWSQDRAQTLADVRQDLSVLYVQIQRLKQELLTTGSPSATASTDTVLDRVSALEQQIQRLTASTEDLEFRVNRIVQDGTNRIANLEFRLVELEGGDISQLGETTTLGGDVDVEPSQPAAEQQPELAIGEQADFDTATKAYGDQRYSEAAEMLARFTQTYPNSPLAARALLLRGNALDELQDYRESARTYLDGFSNYSDSPSAPETLMRLGLSLNRLGQTDAGCQTLSQVEIRFPDSEFAAQTRQIMSELQCQ